MRNFPSFHNSKVFINCLQLTKTTVQKDNIHKSTQTQSEHIKKYFRRAVCRPRKSQPRYFVNATCNYAPPQALLSHDKMGSGAPGMGNDETTSNLGKHIFKIFLGKFQHFRNLLPIGN